MKIQDFIIEKARQPIRPMRLLMQGYEKYENNGFKEVLWKLVDENILEVKSGLLRWGECAPYKQSDYRCRNN